MASSNPTKFDPIGAALYTLPLNDRQYHAACKAFRMLRAMDARVGSGSCLTPIHGPERQS